MQSAVRIENLRKTYGETVAVDGVSLNVTQGQIYGLLGPNGAGKTTTMRCLCTLTTPDSGLIEVAGATDARAIRNRLGYVALYHFAPKQISDRIDSVLDLLQLEPYADKLSGTYSGGLKKRLDLAAGLLHQPSVLILDEPTVGLDIQSRFAIWEFLRKLRASGVTVLISSHYLEEIDALADRVAIIDRGKIIAEGTTDELKTKVGGDRITVRIREFADRQEAEQAKKILQQLPIVQSITINSAQGNAVNLFVTPDPNAISEIQNMLTAVDIEVFSLSQSRPSLDDVFLAATGQTILDAEIAQSELLTASKGKKKSKK